MDVEFDFGDIKEEVVFGGCEGFSKVSAAFDWECVFHVRHVAGRWLGLNLAAELYCSFCSYVLSLVLIYIFSCVAELGSIASENCDSFGFS